MRPSEFVPIYCAHRLSLSLSRQQALLRAARQFEAATGIRSVEDLTEDAVCRFLAGYASTHTPAAVNTKRAALLALWRMAHRLGHCHQPSGEVPRLPEPHPTPEAWDVSQVGTLLRVSYTWPGTIGRCRARDWWPALILTVYWTGARIGSVMAALPADWNAAGSVLVLTRTKNSRVRAYRLHPQAAETVNRIWAATAPTLFYWPHGTRYLWTVFRRIIEAAGIPAPKTSFNLFHRLRRTTLSYCWAVDPSVAQRQADHSSPALTRDRYVDPRIAATAAVSAADVLPVPRI